MLGEVLLETQFTCLAGTKVQILTQKMLASVLREKIQFATQFTCFTSTKVQILTQKAP
jgi:hypothetical protein